VIRQYEKMVASRHALLKRQIQERKVAVEAKGSVEEDEWLRRPQSTNSGDEENCKDGFQEVEDFIKGNDL